MHTRKQIRSAQRTTTRKHRPGSLSSSYGYVILPKGFRLYHVSASHLCALPPSKPIIFTTLHPSEYYMEDAHISVIEVQRDVKLFFMIGLIKGMRVFSALNSLLGNNNANRIKMDYDNIRPWIPLLQKEGLDGWISPIESKIAIEFAIVNDPSLIKIVECKPLQYKWSNSRYTDNGERFIPKNWGTVYPLHSLAQPVKFAIHSRFRPQIEAYIALMEEEDPQGTAFSVLLNNAEITYFDGPVKPITWPAPPTKS